MNSFLEKNIQNFVLIKKSHNKTYVVDHGNSISLNRLAEFLTDAIMGDTSYAFYTSWLKKEEFAEFKGVAGNVYGLEEKKDRIYIYHYSDPPKKKYSYFSATRAQMLEIIDNWMKIICCGEPNKILIAQEKNGNVKIAKIE